MGRDTISTKIRVLYTRDDIKTLVRIRTGEDE